MGEAKARALAVQAALAEAVPPAGTRQVQLDAAQVMVVLPLDMAIHCLGGIASQLATVARNPAAAEVVKKALAHIAEYRQSFVVEASRSGPRVLLAKPGDVPPAG